MWGKIAQLFFKQPELLLNHLAAYAEQAGLEYDALKQRLRASLLGLCISAFAFALSLALLAFAGMLDLALGQAVAQRFWLYALPSGCLLLSALALFYFKGLLQAADRPSELRRQAMTDFELLRALAQKSQAAKQGGAAQMDGAATPANTPDAGVSP